MLVLGACVRLGDANVLNQKCIPGMHRLALAASIVSACPPRVPPKFVLRKTVLMVGGLCVRVYCAHACMEDFRSGESHGSDGRTGRHSGAASFYSIDALCGCKCRISHVYVAPRVVVLLCCMLGAMRYTVAAWCECSSALCA